MNSSKGSLISTVGQKILMAFSGLFLCSFLVFHLVANLLLLRKDGGASYDAFVNFMASQTGIQVLELVLASGFLFHIVVGVFLSIQGWRGRTPRYSVYQASETCTFSSRTMPWTGLLVLGFIVVHLKDFWVPLKMGGHSPHPSAYHIVQSAFVDAPMYALVYIVAALIVGIHVKHGFDSAFRSLGLRFKWLNAWVQGIGIVFWLIIPFLFAVIPAFFAINKLL